MTHRFYWPFGLDTEGDGSDEHGCETPGERGPIAQFGTRTQIGLGDLDDFFDEEEGPVLLGPWPTREAIEGEVRGALTRAGHRRVAHYDDGFGYVIRLLAGPGGYWLIPSGPVLYELPVGLCGFALRSHDVDEGAPARRLRVRLSATGLEVVRTAELPSARTPVTHRGHQGHEAELRHAAGIPERAEVVDLFHEPTGPFSCGLVEATVATLMDAADWQVSHRDAGVVIQTPSGTVPRDRALTAGEWRELEQSLAAAQGRGPSKSCS